MTMPSTIEQLQNLHTENLKELNSIEIVLALKDKNNRQEVWGNIQSLLKNPDNATLVTDIRKLCAHALLPLSYNPQVFDNFSGLDVKTGLYADGKKASSVDLAYYGIFCLYDQVMYLEYRAGRYSGTVPHSNWTGSGNISDGLFWLRNFGDAGIAQARVFADKLAAPTVNEPVLVPVVEVNVPAVPVEQVPIVSEEPVIVPQDISDPLSVPEIDQTPEVIDIEARKKELIESYKLIRITQGLRYSFAASPQFLLRGSDREVLQVKDNVSGDVVLEIGLYTDGPNKLLAFLGLGDDIYEVQERGTVLDYSDLANDHIFDNIVSDLKNRKQNIPASANQSLEEVPVANIEFYNGEKEVIINFANSKGDIVTAAGQPELFDQDSQGNYFPNIPTIQAYYDTQGLDVEFVVPLQTYETSSTLTDFAIDNGKYAGEYQDLEQLKQERKGLLIKYPDGRLEFSYTDDIKHWTTIPGGVDIAMLGSVKRPDAEKTSDNPLGLHRGLIGTASPNRYLAKKTDGSVEILVLYGNAQEQEKVLSKPEYERVLYLDVKGNAGQLDGYWTNQNGKFVYGHTGQGDILRDGKIPTKVKKGNMPSLLIMTKPKHKKEQVDSEVIRPKEDLYDGVLQLDVDNYRKFLEEMIAPGTGVTLETFVDAVNSIPDQSIKKKVITKLQVLYDPSAAQELVGIPKSAQRSDGKIDAQALDAFRSPNGFVYKSLDSNESGLMHGSREWLASKLDNKLDGISFEKFADFLDGRSIAVSYTNPYNKQPLTINAQISGIDNFVLRNKILSYIDRGDIRGMYENVYGMHDNNSINSYLHYRPIDKITPMMMHAMSLRLWYDHGTVDSKEQLDRLKMPADVRTVWKDYKKLGLHLLYPNNGPNNFAIVSKTDFKIYLFLSDGTLVGSQPILVGKNKSDSQWLISNTPAGKYKTNGIYRSPIYNAKYYDKGLGNFIKLWSLEDRFKAIQKTDTGIGIHELYDPENRASSLLADVVSNPSARDRKRVSDGCINASNNPVDFGAIFTHLIPKSDIATCVYVTSTPNDNVVSDYYHMVQGESLLSMK